MCQFHQDAGNETGLRNIDPIFTDLQKPSASESVQSGSGSGVKTAVVAEASLNHGVLRERKVGFD
ncbi:hypothetical protein SAM9427_30790 [Streptomyces sp. ETH9427]|nr:hypothetical protein SAM9427_30790 [Streptomyces sp. ETH9427]